MTESTPVYYSVYPSPLGELLLTSERRHAEPAQHGAATREARPEPEAGVAAG